MREIQSHRHARAEGADSDGRDEDEINAIRLGDRQAFAALYDRHAAPVFTLAKRILRCDADAEALVSDVFVEFWRKPERFDASRGDVRTYLLVLARSRAIDRLRGESRRRAVHQDLAEQLDGNAASASTTESPDRTASQNEMSVEVRNAVASLDPDQRQPLLLAFFDGLTHREIAERLNQPLGTVKSRVRAAMRVLKGKLNRFGGHDDELP